jgi:tRNA A37 N6-isopentenylltransferase MiaA
MLAAGWLEEVEALVALHGPEAHALQSAIGYPQLVQVVQGALPLKNAVEAITLATRQYARRQRVWFKPVLAQAATSNPSSAHWLDPSHYPTTEALADAVEALVSA